MFKAKCWGGGRDGLAFLGNAEMVCTRRSPLHRPRPAASWTPKQALLCWQSWESGKLPPGPSGGIRCPEKQIPSWREGRGHESQMSVIERLVTGRAWFAPIYPVLREKSQVRRDHGRGGWIKVGLPRCCLEEGIALCWFPKLETFHMGSGRSHSRPTPHSSLR